MKKLLCFGNTFWGECGGVRLFFYDIIEIAIVVIKGFIIGLL